MRNPIWFPLSEKTNRIPDKFLAALGIFRNDEEGGEMDKQKTKDLKDLIEAILSLKDANECERFLYDICTPKEMRDLSERWLIARLLDEGKLSYREIHARTGVSVTTVGRVARFLQQENYKGYRAVLDRMRKK